MLKFCEVRQLYENRFNDPGEANRKELEELEIKCLTHIKLAVKKY